MDSFTQVIYNAIKCNDQALLDAFICRGLITKHAVVTIFIHINPTEYMEIFSKFILIPDVILMIKKSHRNEIIELFRYAFETNKYRVMVMIMDNCNIHHTNMYKNIFLNSCMLDRYAAELIAMRMHNNALLNAGIEIAQKNSKGRIAMMLLQFINV